MPSSYVTQEYDFYEAIIKDKNILIGKYRGLEIMHIDHITSDKAIVHTNRGEFICESFKDDAETIYMRVTNFV